MQLEVLCDRTQALKSHLTSAAPRSLVPQFSTEDPTASFPEHLDLLDESLSAMDLTIHNPLPHTNVAWHLAYLAFFVASPFCSGRCPLRSDIRYCPG